ncbi:MAG: hypothetical protein DI598_06290 [Pseudopedobacter saltans]|uniref:Mechanosensitive ion channel MscS domain-containing protein n=1 Tax=Pseudopedobacter saltans TaxID=151895 RepID=A0A2W5F1Q4_9SPHI|nr:MAG: hypothetical protein DI598_06290 [Pseudopedobacter saltans]
MNEFLNFQILDNSVKSVLIALLVILFAFLVRRLISQVVANFIIRFFPKNSARNYSKDFKDFISVPLGNLLFILIAINALDRLSTPSFMEHAFFGTKLSKIWGGVVTIIVVYSTFRFFTGISKFVFSVWGNKALDSKNKSAVQLLNVFGGIVNVILIIIAIIIIAKSVFSLDVSGFITSLGIFSAAIALAGKESLENLIASFIIFLDKPFYIGDYVSVGSNQGTIESIGLRSSRLRSSDQTIIVVPNKQMVDSVVTNFALRTKWKYTQNLEVTLSANAQDLQMLQDAIRKILTTNESVDSQYVYLKSTGGSAHIIYMEYYILVGPAMQTVYDVYSEINKEIITLFQSSNIEFAQETSTVVSVPPKEN